MKDTEEQALPNTSDTSKHAGYKIDQKLALTLVNGGMPVKQVAEHVGCDKSNIYALVSKVKKEQSILKQYQDRESDILSHTKAKLLSKLDDKTINSIPIDSMNDVKNLTVALGVLTDKERLIAGQSTANYSVQTYDKSVQGMRELEETDTVVFTLCGCFHY
jgi:transposase